MPIAAHAPLPPHVYPVLWEEGEASEEDEGEEENPYEYYYDYGDYDGFYVEDEKPYT